MIVCWFFFFKQKTAYDMRISDWSSDVCSSDLAARPIVECRIGDAPDASVRRAGHHFGVGVPFGGVGEEFVERQSVGLHRSVDHWHPSALGGSGGEARPTFQFHGMSAAARRRHTTASWSAAVPGKRLCAARGSSARSEEHPSELQSPMRISYSVL